MKFFAAIAVVLAPLVSGAQWQIVPPSEPEMVFAGESRTVHLTFHNASAKNLETTLRTRLFQESSATTMPAGEAKPWKKLSILAQQTILEEITVDFPDVRAVTSFQLHFLNETNGEIGQTVIQVCPTNLLKQLFAIGGQQPVGVLDADNQLKPLLKLAGAEFHDLETGAGFNDFEGKLAIIGPFLSKDSLPVNLRSRIANVRTAKPPAIIWIQAPGAKSESLPSVYLVRDTDKTIVIIKAEVVAHLRESPRSQLNLIQAAQLAMNPEMLRLPRVEP